MKLPESLSADCDAAQNKNDVCDTQTGLCIKKGKRERSLNRWTLATNRQLNIDVETPVALCTNPHQADFLPSGQVYSDYYEDCCCQKREILS